MSCSYPLEYQQRLKKNTLAVYPQHGQQDKGNYTVSYVTISTFDFFPLAASESEFPKEQISRELWIAEE